MTRYSGKGRLIKIFLLFLGVCSAEMMQAQAPAQYPYGTTVSFVRTWDAKAPEQDGSALMSRPLKDVQMGTRYFDGLGRPVQTVIKQGSLETGGTATDLVSPVVYDEYSREVKKYLPFAANNTGANPSVNDGAFKLNPFQQQETFMTAQYGPQGETVFYGNTVIEPSPLNRPEKTMAPGNSWTGSNRGVEAKHWKNMPADDVKIWKCMNNAGGFGTCSVDLSVNGGIYLPGELYKEVTVDEHGKQVIGFKDKEGKVVLKKVQLTATADDGNGAGYSNWLCTYYIYDDFGNLRCVIQPEGVKTLTGNGWQLNATLLSEQCFRYEYDTKMRMIMKKVPGAGEVYMVYDMRDRLVMTQDANMRAQYKWLITKYDALNRPIETGLWINGNTFGEHQLYANAGISYPSTLYSYELLSVTHYDDYVGLPAGLSGYLTTWNGYFSATDNNNWPYAQMPQKSTDTKGMVTWSQVKILGTANFINTVTYYDDKGRPVQVQSTNITGGTDVMTTQYSWAGQPLTTVQRQQKGMPNPQEHIVITKMQYDDLGRVLTVKKTVNSSIGGISISKPEQLIVSNKYDKLGQLKEKQLGAGSGSPLYEKGGLLNYDYNIRGWMLGMNRNYLSNTGQSGNTLFGFELGYDKLTNSAGRNYTAAQYNGNISGMVWKSDGDDVKRKYDFTYDAANRLLKGLFEQDDALGTWNRTTMDYSMQMGDGADPLSAYDANGNIKAMTQYGWKLGGSVTTPIDNMRYTYYEGTNRLKSVTDFNNDALTKLGDFRTASTHPQYSTKQGLTNASAPAQFDAITDYTYDGNGNMNLDNNKAISSISYNHLNLPSVITVAGKGTISYTYDAAGTKLQKTTVDNTVSPAKTTTTLYVGGAVYENDVLQFIGHEEGRIRYAAPAGGSGAGTLHYDYMLKDHLGNVRMLLTEEQRTDAYPAATMETAQTATEEAFYANLSQTRTPINTIFQYPNDTYTNPNAFVAKVKAAAGSQKIGPSITLRVMAGDKVSIMASSWYRTGGTSPGAPVSPLGDLVAALTNGIGGITSTHGGSAISEITGSGVLTQGATNFLNSQSYTNTKPKAFLNWVLFDDQFRYVASSSGASQVGADMEFKMHVLNDVPMTKNGYLYVYVSNETPNIDVFFDNLQVTHVRGPELEETHYYPFGLTMSGISSKALNGLTENKRKFNKGSELQSKEFNDGCGLEIYSTPLRSLDPQLGRWWQIDSKPDYALSLYSAMNNNPISFNDPLGDTVYSRDASGDQTIKDRAAAALMLKKGQANPLTIKKDGEITINKKAYNALSKEQKNILLPLKGMIDSKVNFGINVVSKDEIIEPLKPGLGLLDPKTGSIDWNAKGLTLGNYYGGGVTKAPEIHPQLNKVTVEIFIQSEVSVQTVPSAATGQRLLQPNEVIMFHEFGHGYFNRVLGDPKQGKKTLDYENEVRCHLGLEKRAYDNEHPSN